MSETPYTHRLAVIAYIIDNDKFLLLKRNTPPRIWGPPGGRLNADENPDTGILREVREETKLEIELIAPAYIWHGNFGSGIYVSIDYLARVKNGAVELSDEHTDFLWASIEDLRRGDPELSNAASGFKLSDFEMVWTLYNKICNRIEGQ